MPSAKVTSNSPLHTANSSQGMQPLSSISTVVANPYANKACGNPTDPSVKWEVYPKYVLEVELRKRLLKPLCRDTKGMLVSKLQDHIAKQRFKRFRKLPVELRLMIWKMALPSRRLIIAQFCADKIDHHYAKSRFGIDFAVRLTAVHNIKLVCKESLGVIERQYRPLKRPYLLTWARGPYQAPKGYMTGRRDHAYTDDVFYVGPHPQVNKYVLRDFWSLEKARVLKGVETLGISAVLFRNIWGHSQPLPESRYAWYSAKPFRRHHARLSAIPLLSRVQWSEHLIHLLSLTNLKTLIIFGDKFRTDETEGDEWEIGTLKNRYLRDRKGLPRFGAQDHWMPSYGTHCADTKFYEELMPFLEEKLAAISPPPKLRMKNIFFSQF